MNAELSPAAHGEPCPAATAARVARGALHSSACIVAPPTLVQMALRPKMRIGLLWLRLGTRTHRRTDDIKGLACGPSSAANVTHIETPAGTPPDFKSVGCFTIR